MSRYIVRLACTTSVDIIAREADYNDIHSQSNTSRNIPRVRRPDPFSFREGCGYARLLSYRVITFSLWPEHASKETVDLSAKAIEVSSCFPLSGVKET